MFRWLRGLVNTKKRPMKITTAETWRLRLSILYGIIGIQTFVIVLYSCFQGKGDWAKYYGLKTEEDSGSAGLRWAEKFRTNKDTKIYRINGFSLEEMKPEQNLSKKGVSPPNLD